MNIACIITFTLLCANRISFISIYISYGHSFRSLGLYRDVSKFKIPIPTCSILLNLADVSEGGR
jgi:hypothetical protein